MSTNKAAKSRRKANVAQGAPETKVESVSDPAAQDATPAPAAAPVAKKGGKRAKGGETLGDVAEGYLAHLAEAGRSEGTVFSYRMDLKIAIDHFGADTKVATLTPERVAKFFGSDGVTRKKNGKRKSSITIAKCRRVFRLAMAWAVEQGFLGKLPIPAEELEHARGAAKEEKPGRASRKPAARKGAKAAEPAPAEPAATETTPAE